MILGPTSSPYEGEAGRGLGSRDGIARRAAPAPGPHTAHCLATPLPLPAGGVFRLELFLPEDYPMAPPKVGCRGGRSRTWWRRRAGCAHRCGDGAPPLCQRRRPRRPPACGPAGQVLDKDIPSQHRQARTHLPGHPEGQVEPSIADPHGAAQVGSCSCSLQEGGPTHRWQPGGQAQTRAAATARGIRPGSAVLPGHGSRRSGGGACRSSQRQARRVSTSLLNHTPLTSPVRAVARSPPPPAASKRC
jgi:hypothetical protein